MAIKTQQASLLKGASELKPTDSERDRENYFSKDEYMLAHIDQNKALWFAQNLIGSDSKIESEVNLREKFKEKFLEYRQSWHQQPRLMLEDQYHDNRTFTPLCLDIETAALCDLACPFCFRQYIATPDKLISESLCYDLIDQAAEADIPSIKFNWRGEPLLHPKLHQFISYAKRRGILETIINTNATTLDQKKSNLLIDAGLDVLIYSFDGGTKETYERMRPGRFENNSFDSVYRNICEFHEIRQKKKSVFPFIKIQMILTQETRDEAQQFMELFEPVVDQVTVTQYTERGGDINDLPPHLKIRLQTELDKLGDSAGEVKAYRFDLDEKLFLAFKRNPCEQPFQRLMITYEGRVGMCCYDWGAQHPVGYVSDLAFKNERDYIKVVEKTERKSKAFQLMSDVSMPCSFNEPAKSVDTIIKIWNGSDLGNVRDSHKSCQGEDVEICSNCSFKDVYDWIEVDK